MSTQKKGFDPLASLFDMPAPDEERRVELKQAPARPPALGDDVPVPSNLKNTAAVPPASDIPPMPAARAATQAPGPNPAELAKILARAAAAKAEAQKGPAAPPAKAGGTPMPAALKAPAPPVAPKGALAKAPPPKAAPPAEKPSLSSRIGAAPPPRKAMSLDEALAAARVDEETRNKAPAAPKPVAVATAAPVAPVVAAVPVVVAPQAPAAPSPRPAALTADQLTEVVSAQIAAVVPEAGAVYIANALLVDDRAVLTALWKAHRARFANQGDIDAAVACSAVVRALGGVALGQLAVAHAVTDKTDWLVWIDLDRGPFAAFRDARSLFSRI